MKMKMFLSLCVAALLATSANATILINESFTPDGALVGQTPEVGGTWAAHSGAGAVPVQVTSGQAVLAQGSGSREDVNSTFAGGVVMGAGDKFYAAFDLTVPSMTGTITDVYFAHFLQGTSNFGSRIWITAPLQGGNYTLAISAPSAIGPKWATDLTFGTTYRVVSSYDYTAMSAQMWINPVSEASTSLLSTGTFQNAMQAYAFRQGSGNTSQLIDNLCVATTFNEALTCTTIPEPASIALMFGCLGIMALRRS